LPQLVYGLIERDARVRAVSLRAHVAVTEH
jgi:hypothetical protein